MEHEQRKMSQGFASSAIKLADRNFYFLQLLILMVWKCNHPFSFTFNSKVSSLSST